MKFDVENLAELAELAELINTLKDSKEVEDILQAVRASAEKICPLVEESSAFCTRLDLKAIKAMRDYGLSMDQAVAVICSRHSGQGALGNVAGKVLS